MKAVWTGDADSLATRLKEGGKVDWGARRNGWPPLHHATRGDHTAVAKLLLGAGAEVHETGVRGFTPLHIAAARGHLDIAELLLQAGADVNAVNTYGYTPLVYAARASQLDIVKLLCSHGATRSGKEVEEATKFGYPGSDETITWLTATAHTGTRPECDRNG